MFDLVARKRTLGEDKALKHFLKSYPSYATSDNVVMPLREDSKQSAIIDKYREKLGDKILTVNNQSWFGFLAATTSMLEFLLADAKAAPSYNTAHGQAAYAELRELDAILQHSEHLWSNNGYYVTADQAKTMMLVWNIVLQEYELGDITEKLKPIVAELCMIREKNMNYDESFHDTYKTTIIPEFDEDDMGRVLMINYWLHTVAVQHNGFEVY